MTENNLNSPIFDRNCESFVISTLLQYPPAIKESLEILNSECFYDFKLRDIFDSIKRVYSTGDTPNLIMVNADLAKHKSSVKLKDLLDIASGDFTPKSIYNYTLRLLDLSNRRKLWNLGLTLMTQGNDESTPIESIHNKAKVDIDGFFDRSDNNRFSTLADTYTNELQKQMILNRELSAGLIYGTPTGFPELDKRGGLTGGTLNIIGAETSMGKTSFANALVLSSLKAKHGVAYYSMEMTAKELNARFASMLTGIPVSKILYDKLDWEDIGRCDNAISQINAEMLHFDEKSVSTIDSIIMSTRSIHSKFGIKGIVVDYLQLVNPGDRTMSREQGVGKIARDLKNLAKELDIWVVALSQLSRDKERPVPSMARLRDSGQIEEAADNVLLLYRILDGKRQYPDPYENSPTNGTAMVIIGKGRNTGIGQFLCAFDSKLTLYRPLGETELDKEHPLNNMEFAPPPPAMKTDTTNDLPF